MEIIIVNTAEEFDRKVADIVASQINAKPDTTLGLATGNTTHNFHLLLTEMYREGKVDFEQVKTINLDEYVGVDPSKYCSCRYRIFEDLLSNVNIKEGNAYVPEGRTQPIQRELETFRKTLEAFGGVDLQIVSVGTNGHIAFNEPGTPFGTQIRIADISPSTVQAKAEMFGGADKVPKHGITVGIRSIMQSKKILLVAKGESKARIMREILLGPVTENVPASVLQLHPFVTVVMDRAAAAEYLKEAE